MADRAIKNGEVILLLGKNQEEIDLLSQYGYQCFGCGVEMSLRRGFSNMPYFGKRRRVHAHTLECNYRSENALVNSGSIREASPNSHAAKLFRESLRGYGFDGRSENIGRPHNLNEGENVEEIDDENRTISRIVYNNPIEQITNNFSSAVAGTVYKLEGTGFLSTQYEGHEMLRINMRNNLNIVFTRRGKSRTRRIAKLESQGISNNDEVIVLAFFTNPWLNIRQNWKREIHFNISESKIAILKDNPTRLVSIGQN